MSRLNNALRFSATFLNTLIFQSGLFFIALGAFTIAATVRRCEASMVSRAPFLNTWSFLTPDDHQLWHNILSCQQVRDVYPLGLAIMADNRWLRPDRPCDHRLLWHLPPDAENW
jgi:hypothetical protein